MRVRPSRLRQVHMQEEKQHRSHPVYNFSHVKFCFWGFTKFFPVISVKLNSFQISLSVIFTIRL